MSGKTNVHPYNAAGRKLLAALISHQLRLKGVDYTLKDMPAVVDSFWAEEAKRLIGILNRSMPVPSDLANMNPKGGTQ